MSPWKTIDNNFFQISYNIKTKRVRFGFLWKNKIYTLYLYSMFETTRLEDDRLSNDGDFSLHVRQRPSHTGIHFNFNEKQLSLLPESDRKTELDRRSNFRETNGVRIDVG